MAVRTDFFAVRGRFGQTIGRQIFVRVKHGRGFGSVVGMQGFVHDFAALVRCGGGGTGAGLFPATIEITSQAVFDTGALSDTTDGAGKRSANVAFDEIGAVANETGRVMLGGIVSIQRAIDGTADPWVLGGNEI